MDLRKLKKLIDLVQESGIAELEITEGKKVKIVKGGAVSVMTATAPATTPAPAAAMQAKPAATPGRADCWPRRARRQSAHGRVSTARFARREPFVEDWPIR